MKKYNERELIKLSAEQVTYLNNTASQNTLNLNSLPGSLPCWIHYNNLDDLALEYMNEKGLNNFNESWDDIKNEGVGFLYRIVHRESAEKVVPRCNGFIKAANTAEVLFFEQRIRYSASPEYKNHLSFAMVNNILNKLFVVTFPSGIIESFIRNRIFPDSDIFNRYYGRYISLTTREKEIFKLMTSGKTNKQISDSLVLSYHTIKTHRKNILNKLQTNNLADLIKIAVYFNLVSES